MMAAHKIQQKVRYNLFKRALLKKRRAARDLQRLWRSYASRQKLGKHVLALYRVIGTMQGVLCRTGQMQRLRNNTLTIQRIVRGVCGRRLVKKMHESATFIQKCYRMHLCKKRQKKITVAKVKVNAMIFRYFWRKELSATCA